MTHAHGGHFGVWNGQIHARSIILSGVSIVVVSIGRGCALWLQHGEHLGRHLVQIGLEIGIPIAADAKSIAWNLKLFSDSFTI